MYSIIVIEGTLLLLWYGRYSALVMLRRVQCYCYVTEGIGEFRPQTDQRSDDSNLQHVKGETGRNRYKAVS